MTDTEIPATRSEKASEDSSARGNSWQKSQIQIKMTTNKYRVMSWMVPDWLQSSNTDWMMHVFQNIEMLPVLLMNYLWCWEQKCYRGNTTSLHISRKTGIAISVWRRNNEGFLQKTLRYSRVQSGKFWWFNNSGSQSLQLRMWEIIGADQETKSHLHWQFHGIRQSLWRTNLESLYVNTAQIRNEWDCWEGSTQN